jgi:hypothetical protein
MQYHVHSVIVSQPGVFPCIHCHSILPFACPSTHRIQSHIACLTEWLYDHLSKVRPGLVVGANLVSSGIDLHRDVQFEHPHFLSLGSSRSYHERLQMQHETLLQHEVYSCSSTTCYAAQLAVHCQLNAPVSHQLNLEKHMVMAMSPSP